jgi:diguanylate cyclase (GGDEF)-like protein
MRYYDNAYALSLAMLRGSADTEENNRLIENVERYHREAAADFDRLRADLHQRFSQRIDAINQRLERQVAIAAVLGLVLIVVILGLTFMMSLSTRKALREVNLAFMNMARDTPDFSRRLQRASDDELGELVGWFNLLADKLEANYKQIELLSITDKLTQLYNRTKIDELFQLELGRTLRYGEALTVILIDLDHFKTINDSLGHQAGDQVLRELAGILRCSVRSTDHLGRWGGEEFIILLPNTDLEQGRQLAEKLRETIAACDFAAAGRRTGSFGVAAYRAGDDADALTKRADDCLYAAKKQGRNRVVTETAPT